jgi:hypothetical protein
MLVTSPPESRRPSVTESVVLPPVPEGAIMPSLQLKLSDERTRYMHAPTCSISPLDAPVRPVATDQIVGTESTPADRRFIA